MCFFLFFLYRVVKNSRKKKNKKQLKNNTTTMNYKPLQTITPYPTRSPTRPILHMNVGNTPVSGPAAPPPPVIVKKKGQGKRHKYYNQDCPECQSELEIPASSLRTEKFANVFDRRLEDTCVFYCPMCKKWQPFSWKATEYEKTDEDIQREQQKQKSNVASVTTLPVSNTSTPLVSMINVKKTGGLAL